MTNEHNETTERRTRPRNGRVALYHANTKGTGAAMRLELKLNHDRDGRPDCFFLEMANQKTKPCHELNGRQLATFDWENKATVKLDFGDVCEMLTVLEGNQTGAGNKQKGIYHETGHASTIISLNKSDRGAGYVLGISRKSKGGEEVFKGFIVVSEAEAIGLRSVLHTGLFFMSFHASLYPVAA